MEAQAEPSRDRARAAQQVDGLFERGAEFTGEVIGRLALGHRQSDKEAEVGRPIGRGNDLVDLFDRIEREIAHAIVEIGLTDEGGGLDRVHVMDLRFGEKLADEPDLARRGAVEMPDAAAPERAQHGRLRVAFYRIEHVTGKVGDEARRGRFENMRANAIDRLDRAQLGNELIDRWHGRYRHRNRTAQRPHRHSRSQLAHDTPSPDPNFAWAAKRKDETSRSSQWMKRVIYRRCFWAKQPDADISKGNARRQLILRCAGESPSALGTCATISTSLSGPIH